MSDIDNAAVVENTTTQPVAPNQGSVDTPASTTGPAETADGEQPQPAEAPEAKPKRDRSAEKRISRLTQQREAAIREAGYWRGIAEAGTPRQQDQQADGERPQQQTRQAPAVDPGEIEHSKTVLERIREAGEDIEDFDDVMETLTSDDFKVSRTMRDFLGEADKPAELAKWLTENPKEAARIARLDPAVAVRALEKAEARLASKPAPKITQAPPPGPTVRGFGTPQFNPEKASMDDYAKHWEARRAKAGIR